MVKGDKILFHCSVFFFSLYRNKNDRNKQNKTNQIKTKQIKKKPKKKKKKKKKKKPKPKTKTQNQNQKQNQKQRNVKMKCSFIFVKKRLFLERFFLQKPPPVIPSESLPSALHRSLIYPIPPTSPFRSPFFSLFPSSFIYLTPTRHIQKPRQIQPHFRTFLVPIHPLPPPIPSPSPR